MDKTIKSGIVAGLAGMPILFIGLAIFYIGGHGDYNWVLFVSLTALFAALLSAVVAGVLSGVLAFPSMKSARESFLPGLIAGFTMITIPLFFALISIFVQIFMWLRWDASHIPLWILTDNLPRAFLLVLPMGVSSLCSAMTTLFIFFREGFSPANESTDKDTDLGSLDMLYDELWRDARTLVADMNRSIALYWIAGLFLFVSGIVIMAYALAGWQRVSGFYDFYIVLAATICGLVQLAMGPFLLYWYSKLRNRYLRLAQMEKQAGA